MPMTQEIPGFHILATLGSGARSTIYAVQDVKDQQVYALKRVTKESVKDQRFLDQALREHEIAAKVDHPAIRKTVRIIKRKKAFKLVELLVLMEMVDGLTLEERHSFTILELCQLCQQVAEALGAMHQAGYVHADIKPNNILVTDERCAKIIDLGQSCTIGTVKERVQGTPDYIAPEQVLRREIVPQTDVFNLGATMYWLFTGQAVPTLIPKSSNSIGGMDTGIERRAPKVKCKPPTEVNDKILPSLSSLVMKCIETDPVNRPQTMQHVRDWLDLAVQQYQKRA